MAIVTTRAVEVILADLERTRAMLLSATTSLRHGTKETRFDLKVVRENLAALERELEDAQAEAAGLPVVRPKVVYTRTTRGY